MALPVENNVHVLIIGAGVTGLLIAHGLKQAGINFSIFESEPSSSHYRPREWSMGIHWSLPQLEALLPPHLRVRLKEAQNDPFLDAPEKDDMKIYNGLDGTILKALPIPRTIRVSRRKMRAFCSQEIDVKACQNQEYGYDLTSIRYEESSVTAVFTNGEVVAGSIIIGSDGPKSQVRRELLGPEADVTPLEIVHSNVAIVYGDAEKAKFVRSGHPVFCFAIKPGLLSFLSIQDVPDPEDPANWKFQVVTSWLGKQDDSLDTAGRLAQVKEKASTMCEPFRSAVLWMPDDTKITYDTMAYWVTTPWDNHDGRVTLAGDAAHPMTPHRGQGLNHAICDASHFVDAMKKVITGESSLKDAITTYSEEVVRRGADEVLISKQNAIMMLNWDQLMESPMMKRSLQKSDLSGS
ncbi:FAD/NAD(P)-binding domain-containing protein [Hyaloscypha variabilis F]|uniref:FAD/NAD(P)-binding domain-containing protein n=1 Tax=Hyaloscypha variabilis (strain UAMH 11265 / GT02V1 / F) TaxID=1149755 RepID=A0A2J6QSZ2_HYAVF|nr:FAD/NAD(P)-binding domain-containing protein [Hyaloscypha variabilis F]